MKHYWCFMKPEKDINEQDNSCKSSDLSEEWWNQDDNMSFSNDGKVLKHKLQKEPTTFKTSTQQTEHRVENWQTPNKWHEVGSRCKIELNNNQLRRLLKKNMEQTSSATNSLINNLRELIPNYIITIFCLQKSRRCSSLTFETKTAASHRNNHF